MTAPRHLRNSLWSVIQYLISALVMVISVRVFTTYLGAELYGVYSLLTVVGSLNLLSGLGLNTATVRFLAKQGKSRESDTDFLVGLVAAVAFASVMVALGIIWKDPILEAVLHVPERFVPASSDVYVLFLISNVPVLAGQVTLALLDALQLVSISSILQGVYTFLYWGSLLMVFALGMPFVAVGYAALSTALLWCAVVTFVTLRQWGRLSPLWDRGAIMQSIRKQLGFGIQVNAGSVIAMLFEPLTKIVASHLLGIREVGLFDLGLKARSFIWGAFARALYPVFPLLAAEHDGAKRREIVADLEEKLLLVILPVSLIVAGTAWAVAQLWIGADVAEIGTTMGVLTISYLYGSTLMTPYYHFLVVNGEAGRVALLHTLNVLANLLGIILTFQILGFYALVLGSGAAMLVSSAVAFRHQSKILHIRIVTHSGTIRAVTMLGGTGVIVVVMMAA
ncbi:MAG: oligosaccharide flippase family protein [Ignavibacteriae bacterium]|nr:oligosaccharide flippase family protein [Ignavibacteriota bacterium]